MAPKTSFVKQALDFPPWAVQWDTRGYLYIGGGGGDQKEVPNKLEIFDSANRQKLTPVASTSVTDDSVSSLDVLTGPDGRAIVFGAVNSNKATKAKGVNEHFRSWEITLPKRVTAAQEKEKEKEEVKGQISPVAQTCLFSKSYVGSADGFQRVTKLSRAKPRDGAAQQPRKRLGVIASSLSPESEVVVFRATTATPGAGDVVQRITPIENREANDVDLVEGENPGEYNLLLITNHEVYYLHLQLDPETLKPKSSPSDPSCIWSSPHPDTFDKRGVRPKYRSVQFLDRKCEIACLLANVAGGSELHLLRLFAAGSAEIILKKKLPKSVGSAVNMTATMLDADEKGEYQVVIAVAAQKADVLVYTIDMPGPSKSFRPAFDLYRELTVSEAPMRAARFAPFASPWSAPGAETRKTVPEQFLRLASISLQNSVSVDYLPLQPASTKSSRPRYILHSPRKGLTSGISLNYLVIGFLLVIQLLLMQSYYSSSSSQLLPQSWQDALAAYRERAAIISSPLTSRVDQVTHTHTGQRILDMLHTHHRDTGHLPGPAKPAIIVSLPEEGEHLSTEVHDTPEELLASDITAKKWEDLDHEQQARWRAKLKKAGAWSADYGETIFKGVFFSELAGAVGRAAAEAMAG